MKKPNSNPVTPYYPQFPRADASGGHLDCGQPWALRLRGDSPPLAVQAVFLRPGVLGGGRDDPSREGGCGEREGEGRRKGEGAAGREATHRAGSGARVAAGGEVRSRLAWASVGGARVPGVGEGFGVLPGAEPPRTASGSPGCEMSQFSTDRALGDVRRHLFRDGQNLVCSFVRRSQGEGSLSLNRYSEFVQKQV